MAKANKNFGEAVARLKVPTPHLMHPHLISFAVMQRATELLQEAERKGEGVFKPYVCVPLGGVSIVTIVL